MAVLDTIVYDPVIGEYANKENADDDTVDGVVAIPEELIKLYVIGVGWVYVPVQCTSISSVPLIVEPAQLFNGMLRVAVIVIAEITFVAGSVMFKDHDVVVTGVISAAFIKVFTVVPVVTVVPVPIIKWVGSQLNPEREPNIATLPKSTIIYNILCHNV